MIDQVLKQALDALERGRPQILGVLVQQDQDEAIAALRRLIAQRAGRHISDVSASSSAPVVAWRYWHSNGDGTESESVYIGRNFPDYYRPLKPPVALVEAASKDAPVDLSTGDCPEAAPSNSLTSDSTCNHTDL